jgi:hypothetical protein
MENVQVGDGQQVARGTVLGTIGNALPCAGTAQRSGWWWLSAVTVP